MSAIHQSPIPKIALLNKFLDPASDFVGSYVDCYSTEVTRSVGLREFVFAFYTTTLFKTERIILKLLAGRPSTDEDARAVAIGESDTFAAWTVEERASDQLLMCDMGARTRSWFMVEPAGSPNSTRTVLRFGSVVVARINRATGEPDLGRAFSALLGFHRVYSRLLLRSAAARIQSTQIDGRTV